MKIALLLFALASPACAHHWIQQVTPHKDRLLLTTIEERRIIGITVHTRQTMQSCEMAAPTQLQCEEVNVNVRDLLADAVVGAD